MTSRRGFTLIELMVGLVLVLIVSGVIYRVLLTSQRVARSQSAQTSLQSNVRSGALVLLTELREIGYDSITYPNGGANLPAITDFRSDLLRMDNDTIRYRAMRGFGITCQIAVDEIRVPKATFTYRPPQVDDELLVFADHDKTKASDDDWPRVRITAVNPNATCGAAPAYALTIDPLTGTDLRTSWSTNVFVGGPVRFSEVMEFGMYEVDGLRWLGAKSVSHNEASYQPVLGPLQTTGLAFRYFNKDHAETTDPRLVRTIEVTVRGQTEKSVALAGGRQAIANLNVTTEIGLRNALRP